MTTINLLGEVHWGSGQVATFFYCTKSQDCLSSPVQVAMDAEILTCKYCKASEVTEIVKFKVKGAKKYELDTGKEIPNEPDDPKGKQV